jgi:DNA-binding PadR family transcriptional regulator
VSSARLKELLVLGVLRAHPLHGYALLQAVEQGLGPAAGLMRSATYAILKRLQERRWITSRREKAGAYPEREVYRVTRAGERAFAELLDGLMSRAVPVGTQPLAVLLAHVDELRRRRRAGCPLRRPRGSRVQGVLDAGLLLLHLDLGRGADVDLGHAAGELGEALLSFSRS